MTGEGFGFARECRSAIDLIRYAPQSAPLCRLQRNAAEDLKKLPAGHADRRLDHEVTSVEPHAPVTLGRSARKGSCARGVWIQAWEPVHGGCLREGGYWLD